MLPCVRNYCIHRIRTAKAPNVVSGKQPIPKPIKSAYRNTFAIATAHLPLADKKSNQQMLYDALSPEVELTDAVSPRKICGDTEFINQNY